AVGVEPGQRGGGRVVVAGPLEQDLVVDIGRDGPAPRAADVVEPAVPGDGRGPPAEVVPVSAEPAEVAGDLQPGLGRDILGVLADKDPYVAQQAGLDGPVDDGERLLIAALGGR